MHTVSPTLHIRLPDEVSPKQQPGCNLLFIEMSHDFVTRKRRGFAHRKQEAEPGRLAARRRLGKEEEFLEVLQFIP